MTVKELYESFGGNYSFAIQMMMNDQFIKRMLTKFVQNNSFKDVVDSYEAKNIRGVFDASHSLKGVCGNLALTPLYEKAVVICEKTRLVHENDFIELDLEINELKEAYDLVITSLKSFLNL